MTIANREELTARENYSLFLALCTIMVTESNRAAGLSGAAYRIARDSKCAIAKSDRLNAWLVSSSVFGRLKVNETLCKPLQSGFYLTVASRSS